MAQESQKPYLPRKKAFEGGAGNITEEICIKMGIYKFNSFQVGNKITYAIQIYAMVQAKIQMCTKILAMTENKSAVFFYHIAC